MRKTISLICLLLVLPLVLVSCAKSEEPAAQIVGKWEWADGSVSEYKDGGGFVSPSGWTGNWSMEGDALTIEGPSEFTVSYQVQEVTAERCVLKDSVTEQLVEGKRVP